MMSIVIALWPGLLPRALDGDGRLMVMYGGYRSFSIEDVGAAIGDTSLT